jgi:hypothetical protein
MIKLNDYMMYGKWEEWLKVKNKIIPENHVKRIKQLQKFKMFFENDNDILKEYYKNLFISNGLYKGSSFNEMMAIVNFSRTFTDIVLKLCLSVPPHFIVDDEYLQKKVNNYTKKIEWNSKLKEILASMTYGGNVFVREIVSNNKKTIQVLDSSKVFLFKNSFDGSLNSLIILSQMSKDQYNACIYDYEKNINIFLNIVTNDDGEIESIVNYKNTNITNKVYNFTLFSPNEYDVSPYSFIETLQANYINRFNQLSKMIDIFAAPIVTGPNLIQDDDIEDSSASLVVNPVGDIRSINVQKRNTIETGSYVGLDEGEQIKYVQTQTQIEEQIKYIRMIEDSIVNTSRLENIVYDKNIRSQVTSSKAFRMLFNNALDTARDYCSAMGYHIVDILKYNLEIPEEKNIEIIWNDGLMEFYDEKIENATKRIDNGTMSTIEAIMYIDGVSKEQADKVVENIKELKIDEEGGEQNDGNI